MRPDLNDHAEQWSTTKMMTIKKESESSWNASDTRDRESTGAKKTASGFPAQPGESLKSASGGPATGMDGDQKKNFLDLPRLIRSVQRAEGNIDCFGRKDDCNLLDCAWRAYCLNSPHSEG
jgi:hypothetical protein